MSRRRLLFGALVAVLVAAVGVLVLIAPDRTVSFDETVPEDAVARGRYLVTAGACESCHTPRDRPELVLAGGTVFPSPFGTFYIPNITPDRRTGIGGWSDEDFVRAMRNGVSPRGSHYYPAFPYRWYRHLTDADLIAIKRYLDSIPPIVNAVRDHDLVFPFTIRQAVGFWKLVNMGEEEIVRADFDEAERRGAYLTEALGHCGACHTSTVATALYLPGEHFAGDSNPIGPYAAPNITPHPTGIGQWSVADVERVLAVGMRPDGRPVRGAMSEYVAESTSRLTPSDRAAMVAYIRRVEPEEHRVERTPELSVPVEERDMTLAFTVTRHPDVERGRMLALTGGGKTPACTGCHGVMPGSDTAGMPVMRGQSASYLRERLADYASGRTPNPVMSPIAKALSDDDMAAAAAFYASLQPPFGSAVAVHRAVSAVPADAAGRRLALTGDPARGLPACAECHAGLGEGVAPAYPYLAGQDASYVEAQFAYWKSGRRDPGELAVMPRIAAGLTAAEVRAVATFYASLGGDPLAPTGASGERPPEPAEIVGATVTP